MQKEIIYCSVLQCVAACCRLLQSVLQSRNPLYGRKRILKPLARDFEHVPRIYRCSDYVRALVLKR